MKVLLCLSLTILLMGLFATADPALAGKVYRWVDDNGEVHFSNTPPEERRAEQLIIKEKGAQVIERLDDAEIARREVADIPLKDLVVGQWQGTDSEGHQHAWKFQTNGYFEITNTNSETSTQGILNGRWEALDFANSLMLSVDYMTYKTGQDESKETFHNLTVPMSISGITGDYLEASLFGSVIKMDRES